MKGDQNTEAVVEDITRQVASAIDVDKKQLIDDVTALREWAELQPHLPQIRDDRLLVFIIMGCKHSMERSKKALDTYYTARTVAPDLFTDRDTLSPELEVAFNAFYLLPLPTVTPEGWRVSIHGFTNPDTYNAFQAIKMNFMICDISLRDYVASGDFLIYDLAGATWGQYSQFTVSLLRKYIYCIQNAYPTRVSQIHILNAPSFLNTALNFFKSFMKEKIADRINIHEDFDSLHQFVSKDLLPKEYGGTKGTVQDLKDLWWSKIQSYREWFQTEGVERSDESKRLEPANTPVMDEASFGVDGSFRKLNVD